MLVLLFIFSIKTVPLLVHVHYAFTQIVAQSADLRKKMMVTAEPNIHLRLELENNEREREKKSLKKNGE